ncbi:MAG: DUF4139 domain-containing protein [Polyangiaceae bacterium]
MSTDTSITPSGATPTGDVAAPSALAAPRDVAAPHDPDAAREVPSRATAVTFFEDRAEVVRTAAAKVRPGSQWIALTGASPYVDERTVAAKVLTGAALVSSARVRWRAHDDAALGREEIERLRAEEEDARRALDDAQRARARGTTQIDQINALYTKWSSEAARVAPGVRAPEKLGAWREAWTALEAAARHAHSAISAANERRERAEEKGRRAALRLREGRTAAPRYEAAIEVDIEVPLADDGDRAAEIDIEIEVIYRVPCALWRPEHLFRLGEKEVEIVTWATVWHAAGEKWEGVRARFSTARPARDAAPPLVRDDILHLRRKTAEERTRVIVEARDQTREVTGIDRGTRAVDEMPGVDDGGEPLVLTAAEPLTIASNGRPLRVEVSRRALPAEIDRVLFSERSGAAHLRATATLTGGPLLAGPVRVARGPALVGRSKIGFIGGGEPFEIGFGPDDGVRARRHVEEQRDTTAIIGTQKIRRKVDVFLSNLSGDSTSLNVTERIPVSELDDVEISILEAGDFGPRDADGFLHARVTLAPQETRRVSFAYEIRAGSNVVLPF